MGGLFPYDSTLINIINDIVVSETEIVSNDIVIKKPVVQSPLISKNKVFKNRELYQIDYNSFNASYNKLAATAQLKLGLECADENSAAFISRCAIESDLQNIVPNFHNYDEIEKHYRDLNQYYSSSRGCWPLAGDILLLDLNLDDICDHAEIISYRHDKTIITVGLINGIVATNKWEMGCEYIYGTCKPDYNMTRLEFFGDRNFPFNAVDTVVATTNPEYVSVMAENGIELIARYINPEGRIPLTKEEAQLYFNEGIRVMMIYEVGAGDPYAGYDLGYSIGLKALEYARNLNATKGTPIFFCCDCTPRPMEFSKVAEFLRGVHDAMQGEYGVGLYGGYYVTEAMYNIGIIDAYWQCWGFSDRYVSDNYDIIQWSNSTPWFEEIPYLFDANHVKNAEKVSYILTETAPIS